MDRRFWLLAYLGVVAASFGCDRARREPQQAQTSADNVPMVLDLQWTLAAAKRAKTFADAGKTTLSLPMLRVYDPEHRLILQQSGYKPGTIAQIIGAASATDRQTLGPAYASTLADVETRDHRRPERLLKTNPSLIIFDYWAAWCVPCRTLEKELLAWAAHQRHGAVTIVRVEADWAKFARAQGQKVYSLKKGADGRLIKVEMR
jgi:thiol-disulfide isomerase/thioredoxin